MLCIIIDEKVLSPDLINKSVGSLQQHNLAVYNHACMLDIEIVSVCIKFTKFVFT